MPGHTTAIRSLTIDAGTIITAGHIQHLLSEFAALVPAFYHL